jgi:hypothetical protein
MFKKFSKIFIFIIILLSGINHISALNGYGTSINPYKISSCIELNQIRNYSDSSFELINNINCSDSFNWKNNYGTGFEPIGDINNIFSGDLIGNGFVIYNLFINVTRDDVGLFGQTQNLSLNYFSLENFLILAHGNNVGGVIGFANSGTNLNNIKVKGNILSTGDNIGGMIGDSTSVNIFTSYFKGDILGENFIGGFVGNNAGKIKDSFSIVTLYGNSSLNELANTALSVNIYWLNFENNTNSNFTTSSLDIGGESYFNSQNPPMDTWDDNMWDFSFDGLPDLIPNKPDSFFPDNLIGNHLNITTNIVGLTINGTNNWISNKILNLNFFKSEVLLFEITRNLKNKILNMSKVKFIEILNMTEHSLIISGFDMQAEDTRYLYFKLHNSLIFKDEICVKDSQINSSLEFSFDCSKSDEFLFSNISLIPQNNTIINSYVSLSYENYNKSILKLSGLTHSAVIQSLADSLNKSIKDTNPIFEPEILIFNLTGDGTLIYPFKIYTCNDLNQIRLNLSYFYELKNNINCNSFNNFKPIGDYTDKFTGGLLGKKHKISNLKINSTFDYVGLFGAGDSSDISNLYLENFNIHGNSDYVGGLFGSISNSQISNIIVTGTVIGKNNVGGILGFSSSTNIYTSYFNGNVSGENNIGGIVGINRGSVQNSFSIVTLNGTSDFDVIGTGGLFSNNFWLYITGNPPSSLAGEKINDRDYFIYRNAPTNNWNTEIWNWNFKNLPNFDFTDKDNDGVKDVLDKLVGNTSDIETNIKGIKIEGTSTWIENGNIILSFKNKNGTKFLEVEKDLTIYPFYMENIIIELRDDLNDNNLLVKGFDLKNNESKTIYFKFKNEENFYDYICIKDEEINSINKVSKGCDNTNEYIFEDIMIISNNSFKSKDHIKVSWENYSDKLLKIEGLKNSAIVQFVKSKNTSSQSKISPSTDSTYKFNPNVNTIEQTNTSNNVSIESKSSSPITNQQSTKTVKSTQKETIIQPSNKIDINKSNNKTLENITSFECSFWKCKFPVGATVLWLIW